MKPPRRFSARIRISAPGAANQSRWRRACRHHAGAAPETLRPWLLDEGSLTQRVRGACAGALRIEVVSQRLERPTHDERRRLAINNNTYALVRQVRLMCGNTPWVFARTVIPLRTLTGEQRRLRYLRTRSLGAVLFSDPSMSRETMEVACLRPSQRLHAAAAGVTPGPPLWARRTLFRLRGKALLVCEVFLPAIGVFRR